MLQKSGSPNYAEVGELNSMKQDEKHRPLQIIVVTAIALFVIANIVFVLQSDAKYDRQMQHFYELDLFGRITEIKDQHRGSYYLEIKAGSEKRQFNSLPIALEVKEYHIETGDSVSKPFHSNIISFYKQTDNVTEKLCEVQLY